MFTVAYVQLVGLDVTVCVYEQGCHHAFQVTVRSEFVFLQHCSLQRRQTFFCFVLIQLLNTCRHEITILLPSSSETVFIGECKLLSRYQESHYISAESWARKTMEFWHMASTCHGWGRAWDWSLVTTHCKQYFIRSLRYNEPCMSQSMLVPNTWGTGQRFPSKSSWS